MRHLRKGAYGGHTHATVGDAAYLVDGNQWCETGHAPMLPPRSRQIAKHRPLTDP